jgi:hypothetical protein
VSLRLCYIFLGEKITGFLFFNSYLENDTESFFRLYKKSFPKKQHKTTNRLGTIGNRPKTTASYGQQFKRKKTTISLTPDPKELTIEDQQKQKHQPLQTTSSTANPQSLPTTLHKDGSSSHHKTTIT